MFVCLWRPSLCWRLCAGTLSPLINLYHPPSRQQTRRTALSHSQTQSYWRQLASSILWTLAHLSLFLYLLHSSLFPSTLHPCHYFFSCSHFCSFLLCMHVCIYLFVCVCVRRADSEDGNCVFGDSDTSTPFIHTVSSQLQLFFFYSLTKSLGLPQTWKAWKYQWVLQLWFPGLEKS